VQATPRNTERFVTENLKQYPRKRQLQTFLHQQQELHNFKMVRDIQRNKFSLLC